jgi:hypothetical protein
VFKEGDQGDVALVDRPVIGGNGTNIFVYLVIVGRMKKEDANGTNWAFTPDPPAGHNWHDIAVGGTFVYLSGKNALTNAPRLARFNIANNAWESPRTISSDAVRETVMLARIPSTSVQNLYVSYVTTGNVVKLYRSTDDGVSWTQQTSQTLNATNDSAIDRIRALLHAPMVSGTTFGVFFIDHVAGNNALWNLFYKLSPSFILQQANCGGCDIDVTKLAGTDPIATKLNKVFGDYVIPALAGSTGVVVVGDTHNQGTGVATADVWVHRFT